MGYFERNPESLSDLSWWMLSIKVILTLSSIFFHLLSCRLSIINSFIVLCILLLLCWSSCGMGKKLHCHQVWDGARKTLRVVGEHIRRHFPCQSCFSPDYFYKLGVISKAYRGWCPTHSVYIYFTFGIGQITTGQYKIKSHSLVAS